MMCTVKSSLPLSPLIQESPRCRHPFTLPLSLPLSQVLARTTRGMMCTERALRVLCAIEYPRPQGMPLNVYRDKLTRLAHTKFTYLVSAQVSFMTIGL